jgi:hypothetical protein
MKMKITGTWRIGLKSLPARVQAVQINDEEKNILAAWVHFPCGKNIPAEIETRTIQTRSGSVTRQDPRDATYICREHLAVCRVCRDVQDREESERAARRAHARLYDRRESPRNASEEWSRIKESIREQSVENGNC